MHRQIERVGVIGAGTMGAAIAAHVANAGIPVLLLDIVPRETSPAEEKKGLTLEHPAVRNRIVREGLERIGKLQPASFMSRAARSLVEIGNLEDDLQRLADADWVIEVVVERLDIKRQLMERLEKVVRPGAIVTTNTSGLPIAKIVEGRSEAFRESFFGTHFFNPPRYMKLLEVIRGEDTDSAAVDRFVEFASETLGKGVVFTKDTPNFIANRLLSVHGTWAIETALAEGYRFEEIDELTGPLVGRPKTATFRLQDLVGIDVAWGVAQNLFELIPEDPDRDVLKAENATRVIGGLIERGRLGNKTGSGFYRKAKGPGGKRVYEVLDPESFDYEAPRVPEMPAVAAVRKIRDIGDRLNALIGDAHRDDRGARFVRCLIGHFLSYSSRTAPEIAFDLASVDRAVRWGFAYEVGPFELWDRLGVAETAAILRADGFEVPAWVDTMLEKGDGTFYRTGAAGDTGAVRPTAYWDWASESYVEIERDPAETDVASLEIVRENASATLRRLEDRILLLEVRSKMNAIDGDVVDMLGQAADELDDDRWIGLVIGNDGKNFSVGADLMGVGNLAMAGDFAGILAMSEALQMALARLRGHSKPVVAAVHGMALGGGLELALGSDRIVAAAESYVGLVEVGAGLVPAGGGMMELVRRVLDPIADEKETDPLPVAQRILETVAMAKVSTSAAEGGELGFLADGDRIVMNRDHLLFEAASEVEVMVEEGYRPEAPARLWAGGRDLLAALRVAIWSLEQAGWASEHDALVAGKVAWILCGGDGSIATRQPEGHFLRLEREAFVDLVKTEKTQARMRHLLETGKPLRN